MKRSNSEAMSLSDQKSQIEAKLDESLSRLRKVGDDPEALYNVIWSPKEQGGLGDLPLMIPAFLIVSGEFRLAWKFMISFDGHWRHPGLSNGQVTHILDSNALWNHEEYWKAIANSKLAVGAYLPLLRFEKDQVVGVYDEQADKWVKPDDWVEKCARFDPKVRYDATPKSRNATVRKVKDYYLKYDSLPEAFAYLEACMPLDRREEAEELLIRIAHILSTKPPSKSKLDMPPVEQTWPIYQLYRTWLDARNAGSPKEKRELGWTAIQWLFEIYLRNADAGENKHEHDYLHDAIAIAAECDIFDKKQPEFLGYFKLLAMTRTIEAYRHLSKDKTPLLKANQLGMKPVAWYVERRKAMAEERRAQIRARYDASLAELKASGGKSKK